ncbi:MAG TPA: malto-oligosyltrehalose trehalohydrolase [Silvibacterium sp.]|nr:malto-oligosyltrehalose trehalohydrolase [Silvibacterium sp.]
MLASGTSTLIGAIPTPRGTHFRVWAPIASGVEVVFTESGARHPLAPEASGYFAGVVPSTHAGDRYRFSLDGGEAFPDPASRCQPEGPHGPSEIVDPGAFRWSEHETNWPGVSLGGQVFYELHIGTFTPEGTYAAAAREFARLRELGITVLECMPLAEFAGSVGWGYDGVDLFSPFHGYGRPDDLRRMIDAAHQHGLGIIIDVVYNHLGPDGNYLVKYSDRYFSENHTEWGASINFDGEDSRPVREFFLANVAHWISEYHFDGLRLDATQSVQDNGSHGVHILTEIGRRAREAAAGRSVLLIAENEPQDSCLICSVEEGGFGLDGVWNDDFHHSAVVALTGRREAYFSDHLGRPQEFISSAKYGYLYQGQYYSWQKNARGTSSLHVDSSAFITFLENHDQIANLGRSLHLRLLSSPARYRAMTGLWLLSPGTPMFFQGQEYGAETPFHYFADHAGDLAESVTRGRREFMLQFADQDTPEMRACSSDPENQETYLKSRLDPSEQQRFPEIVRLHTDLLALRRDDPVLNHRIGSFLDGAVLSDHCFVLRYVTSVGEDRLLVVNFGVTLDLPHLPEPLVAPPAGCAWQARWSSERPEYGGSGSYVPDRFGPWHIIGECTQLLVPVESQKPFHPEKPKSGLRE